MRRNPDPYPVEIVFDPEKLLQRHEKREKPNTSRFQQFNSFSDDDIENIEDIGFDLKFEQYLFRSKSESNLKETIPDPNKFQAGADNSSFTKGETSENVLLRDKGNIRTYSLKT